MFLNFDVRKIPKNTMNSLENTNMDRRVNQSKFLLKASMTRLKLSYFENIM